MLDEFEGKTIADKYQVDEGLVETDLGTFYRGWHTLMDRPVIIKVLTAALAVDRRLVDRFVDEAKAESHITHDNILSLVDFGIDGQGRAYAVYENNSGELLRDLMTADDPLPLDTALAIAADAAAGLAAGHRNGVVHRAFGPERVLVQKTEDGELVKVFAFGSEPIGKGSMADIRYLAPEQYESVGSGDERSDIFSLGVVLYEMLAGRRPFEGDSIAEIINRQEAEPPPPLSAFREELPADLEPMILSAIALDADRRYQEMGAFAEDLSNLSRSLKGGSQAAAAKSATGTRKHNIWQTAFIVFAGIAVLAAALIYATSSKKTDPTTQLQADAGGLPVQPIGPATGAQEDSLSKLPPMTDAEIMSQANSAMPMDSLPGGDGYNPWANGGQPPAGAPPAQYVPPGGQYYTIDPNGGSQFMPNDSGVVLVPVPANTNTAPKPTPSPKGPPGNTAVKPSPETTPKPLATPADKPPAGGPARPNSTPKPRSGKQTDS